MTFAKIHEAKNNALDYMTSTVHCANAVSMHGDATHIHIHT